MRKLSEILAEGYVVLHDGCDTIKDSEGNVRELVPYTHIKTPNGEYLITGNDYIEVKHET